MNFREFFKQPVHKYLEAVTDWKQFPQLLIGCLLFKF